MNRPLHVNSRPSSPFLKGTQIEENNEICSEAILHQYLLHVQDGRLHPDSIPVDTMERVLDIGCGSGEWIFDLSKRYPRLHIYGVDVSEQALHQAKVRRNTAGLHQVELRHLDLLQPLPIPDQYVDFIHMRRFARFVAAQAWPELLNECGRVLRPSGWLAVVELELCEISSPACLTLHRAMLQACAKLGRTLDACGTTLGVAQRLFKMLQQVGLDEVNYDVDTVDLGFMAGPSMRFFLSEMMQEAFLTRPLVVQESILTAPEFDELVIQADLELQAPDLCGWALLFSAYGRRTAETQ